MKETVTFLDKFRQEIQSTYIQHAPGMLKQVAAELDFAYHWLNFRFGIASERCGDGSPHSSRAHPRQVDELYIRLHQKEISIDFSPGASVPTCLIDNLGLRWIELDLKGIKLSQKEKTEAEALATALYVNVREHAPMLRLVLGGAIAVTKEARTWL